MPDAGFPIPVGDVVSTLAEIFRHQGKVEITDVLEQAHASFDQIGYDDWNGGTYYWALRLEVPVACFVTIEPRLGDLEREIEAKLGHFTRGYPNEHLSAVSISPLSTAAAASLSRTVPTDDEVGRIWPGNTFRLFLSHLAVHKIAVSKLKEEFRLRGVSAFVAHEDVEPSLEWQNEIELALRSMHALAALITPDFHASHWTDQEVGWAIGRDLLVLPVRLKANPYGFMGKVQGVSGDLDAPAILASSIVDILLKNPRTHGEMRRALAWRFANATSYKMAKTLRSHITGVKDFTEDEINSIRSACSDNKQVADAFGVSAAVLHALGSAPTQVSAGGEDTEIPF